MLTAKMYQGPMQYQQTTETLITWAKKMQWGLITKGVQHQRSIEKYKYIYTWAIKSMKNYLDNSQSWIKTEKKKMQHKTV